MAMADSVPGVSGGTIAFIMGFYDDFIFSVDNLVYNKDIRKKIEAIQFLFKLGIGWVVGLVLSILFVAEVFESNIYLISSVFMGFIIASIPILVKEELPLLLENKKSFLYTLVGIFIVYFISSTTSSSDLIKDSQTAMYYVYFFIAGVIAISAMVLPGISGSTILLILGLYAPIIYAIKGFLSLDFTYFFEIVCFGVGILVGAVVTVKVISICLKKYRAKMIYLVIGLMIGSIYAVANGPTTLEIPQQAMTLKTFDILFFSIGMLMIFLLEKLKYKKDD